MISCDFLLISAIVAVATVTAGLLPDSCVPLVIYRTLLNFVPS